MKLNLVPTIEFDLKLLERNMPNFAGFDKPKNPTYLFMSRETMLALRKFMGDPNDPYNKFEFIDRNQSEIATYCNCPVFRYDELGFGIVEIRN